VTDIFGSTVLVTGANGALGRQFVEQALERGARRVYATARTVQRENRPAVVPLELDVTDAESIKRAADASSDVSILINNAAIPDENPVTDVSIDRLRAIFETNVLGPLAMAQTFAPILAMNGGGALVNVRAARSWVFGTGLHTPSKVALWGLTNTIRVELKSQNTQVVGAHLVSTDPALTVGLNSTSPAGPAPADIVRDILNGLEAGESEVIFNDIR
jgi:NAD(P)-dependent dehydrogenase (short-subunit alcohol dehydrogenase family)